MKLKTKQERKDTPLANTPEGETPITDIKTALADINARSAVRQESINASRAKVNAARVERSRKKTNQSEGRLYGLASFAGTTGKQKQ